MANQLYLPFEQPALTGVPTAMYRHLWMFANPQHLVTLHPFTITNVNVTPTIAAVGGRPALQLAGAGAATDGSNFCYGTAAHRFVASKQTRFVFSWRAADATNHAFAAGLSVVTTSLTAASRALVSFTTSR